MSKDQHAEVVIIGSGPAGISAAVWCTELGLQVLLLDRAPQIGGQLHWIHNPIEDYPGRRAKDGREMLVHFRETMDHFAISARVDTDVASIDIDRSVVILSDGGTIAYHALIIATGVRRRRLGIPGEEEFLGKGIIESGARDKETLAGKRVVIVGGGDAAAENALMISEFADSVTLIHRRADLSARRDFQEEMGNRRNIQVLKQTQLIAIKGDSQVGAVALRSGAGNSSEINADAVLIRIGVVPNSELFRGILDLDERNYIRVNGKGETNVAGIFAAGDVANPVSPTLSTASGTGASAAKSCFQWHKTG